MSLSLCTCWRLGLTGLAAVWISLAMITGCNSRPSRLGDEIIAAGQYVHTGTRVVT